MYAANEPSFLNPISYGTQQVDPQFLIAYILTSGPAPYVCLGTNRCSLGEKARKVWMGSKFFIYILAVCVCITAVYGTLNMSTSYQ